MTEAKASPRRTRARRGEGEKLREQILAAAERLLAKTGDEEAVSIRGVAEAVGVTPPSIYLHFADKSDLIVAVCERHFTRLDEVIEEAARGVDDPLEELVARGRAYVRFGLENPEQYRILFMSNPAAMPEAYEPERLMQSAAFDHLVEAVLRALSAGVIEGDPALVSVGLWAAVHGVTSLLISKPDFPWPDRDAMIEHVLRTQLHGVAARPAPGRRRARPR